MNQQARFLFFMFLFIWIMSSNPNSENTYPIDIDKNKILNEFKLETNNSRYALLNEYDQGYGNLTGFYRSYNDALSHKNISDWPFHNTFEEEETYSVLPNFVSLKAANVWNFEGHAIELPGSRNDLGDLQYGNKLNTGTYPLNISGFVKGNFKSVGANIQEISLPLPQYLVKLYDYRNQQRIGKTHKPDNNDDDEDFGHFSDSEIVDELHTQRTGNFTKPKGSIKLQLSNSLSIAQTTDENLNDTSLIGLQLKLNDELETDEHLLSLSGVYHQSSGNVLVSTRSAKFNGIHALPQLSLSPNDQYNKTKWLLFNEFNKTSIDDIEFTRIEELVDSSDQCEYIGYFHVESTNLTVEELQIIDSELSNPIGRPHKPVPDLKISSGLLYSPNCGLILEAENLSGRRGEVFDNSLRNTILVLCMAILLQIFLLIRQMAKTNTPTNLSKLSFWTITTMNMADGTLSVVSLLCSMIYTDLYIQFAVCAFLAFTCSAVYEMKYAIQIYCTQVNERSMDWRTMLQGTPLDEIFERRARNETGLDDTLNEPTTQNAEDNDTGINDTNANTNTNANNDTNNIPADNIMPTNPADEQTVSAELYTRHFFAMIIFLFFLLNVITWPKRQRQIFEYLILTIFNSYWVPQIYRNVLRGSRVSFSWEFILSTSGLRLLPIIYIELFQNPFSHHKDASFTIFLLIWLSVQVFVLYLQELLGPRFFLNDKYLPKSYDYHPLINKGDIESGFGIDEEDLVSDRLSSTDDDSRNLKYVTDCAICMQKLEVPILNRDELNEVEPNQSSQLNAPLSALNKAHLIERRKYMVTPCRHIFHTECLENWMMYKLQCPVCRNNLPPA